MFISVTVLMTIDIILKLIQTNQAVLFSVQFAVYGVNASQLIFYGRTSHIIFYNRAL